VSVNDGFCTLARRTGAAFRGAEMPGLRELLAAHAPLLILDAASTRVQVGACWSEGRTEWRTSDDEAGVGIFQCLEELPLPPGDAGAFVFCEGPGSMLGIRTAAMAIRTWNVLEPRPVFAYSSLALVAHALGNPDLGIISDARRDTWHHYRIGAGLRRIAAAELTSELAGHLAMPEHFRHWSPLPADVTRVPYSLAAMLPQVADAELFRATDAPDAFLHEEPSYVTWTPRIHRAPAS